MLTKLPKGNAQLPMDKEPGDIVVLNNGDIFCYDGGMWVLLGGRYVPEPVRKAFLSYVSDGIPDVDSAKFDLPMLVKLDQIFGDLAEVNPEEFGSEFKLKLAKTYVDKLFNNFFKVCEKLSRVQEED